MYRERFDADWETLSTDEALRRMFALGVAAALGDPLPEERERIRAQADSAYDRNVYDLSYREGKQKARGVDVDGDPDAVWNELLETEFGASSAPPDRSAESGDVPGAVERATFLSPDGDDLERLRLPDLLRRDD